ncbi:LOW QUALITY PROTEIN: conserved hypothetical protein, partial [Streptomyces sp. SPB074]
GAGGAELRRTCVSPAPGPPGPGGGRAAGRGGVRRGQRARRRHVQHRDGGPLPGAGGVGAGARDAGRAAHDGAAVHVVGGARRAAGEPVGAARR